MSVKASEVELLSNYIFSCGLLVVTFAYGDQPNQPRRALQMSRDLMENSPDQNVNTGLKSYRKFCDLFTMNNK